MTSRAVPIAAYHASAPTPDFSRLTCLEACRRVRQLICAGFAEQTVADLVGWQVADVRRACSPSIPSALKAGHG